MQPGPFGTVTRTPWREVVTVTTVGHGDVVPVTAGETRPGPRLPAGSRGGGSGGGPHRRRAARPPDPRTGSDPGEPAPVQSSGTVPRKRARGDTPSVPKR